MPFELDPDRKRPSKRLGAFLGLFDAPVFRDWLAWWTVAWTAIAGLSIAFPSQGAKRSTSLPMWLDIVLATVTFGALFGLLPAYIRVVIRRRRLRRERARMDSRLSPGPQPDTRTSPSLPATPGLQVGERPSMVQEPRGANPTPTPTVRASDPKGSPRSPGPSTPIAILDGTRLHGSSALSRARESLPYPLARAARRLQLSTDPKDAYEATLRTSETVSVVLGALATAWARDAAVSSSELSDLKRAIGAQGASSGHWQGAVQSVERPMYQHDLEIPGMVNALKKGKGGKGLLADLKEVLGERNRWAHGAGPQSRVDAAERLVQFLPVLERVLDKVAFLTDSDWVLISDVKLRRRERDFHVMAARAMGDHPDFERSDFTTTQPLAEDVFYVLAAGRAIDLTPLIVMRQCPECHQNEVAYADRLDERNGVALKTFDRAHAFFEPGLVEDMHALLTDEPRPDSRQVG